MRKILCFLMLVFFTGCAVVNVYVTFPEEKIKEAAEDILAPPEESEPTGLFKIQFTKLLYAEEIVVKKELKTSSPAIEEAKKKRFSWWSELKEFEKSGYIGETNDFRVVIKNLPDDVKMARKVKEIVKNENEQREIILKELLRINNAAPQEEKKFREIFAETAQKYAPEGTWIQDRNGNWKRK